MSNKNGVLYVVATPIGNLGDLSARAQQILSQSDVIVAEDTRHSRRLLHHFGINTPLLAMHEHNERETCGRLIAQLQEGARIALISDAGTPLVSDPGFHLVREAHGAGIPVSPIPGPSAALAALSAAGLASDRFVFEGFLPAKRIARRQRLQALAQETRTLIFYEAPHRIVECLEDIAACMGEQREATLARELTKLHETIRKNSVGELCTWVSADPEQQLGEIVLVVAGAPAALSVEEVELLNVLQPLLAQLPLKQAVALTTEITGGNRNAIYERALQLKSEEKNAD
ncbi:MAG: 16S rRNA (cytidine(1402)-2'-O)-methyltransferase [Gammaproteobacteria bacterium]|nr:16S rRNA (cytidine(1402)-2'-O)-methyltransferase [Gammaproteobacteria bacterium]